MIYFLVKIFAFDKLFRCDRMCCYAESSIIGECTLTNKRRIKEVKELKNAVVKKIIRLYLFLAGGEALATSLASAIFVIFLIERGGLDLFEVSIVFLASAGTVFVLEIPTGVIADVFGRKSSCVYSYFLTSLGLFVFAISDSLFAFVIAAIILATRSALISGASEAWLVDSLKHNSYSGNLISILTKENQVIYSAGIVGALAGAFLADKDITIPFVIGGFVMLLVGTVAAILMKEEYFVREKFSFRTGIQSMKETVKISVAYGRNNKTVRFILLMGLAQSITVKISIIQYQPFFFRFFPNKASLGFLLMAIGIATIAGATLSSWFLSKLQNPRKALVTLQIAIGLGVLIAGVSAVLLPPLIALPIALSAFLFFNSAGGAFAPINGEYLNENIPSKERATLISFKSMAYGIGSATGLIFGGYIAEMFSISILWMLAGGLLVIFSLIMRNNSKRTEVT